MLLQLPISKKFDEQRLISFINPGKDVDGLNEQNIGKLVKNEPAMRSCTPAGIINLLRSQNIEIEGKKIVVIGRSLLVGKPLSLMLLNLNATVIMTHSKTINLNKICKEADILIAAAGKPNLIDSSFVKEGAVIIDVGIHRLKSSDKSKKQIMWRCIIRRCHSQSICIHSRPWWCWTNDSNNVTSKYYFQLAKTIWFIINS